MEELIKNILDDTNRAKNIEELFDTSINNGKIKEFLETFLNLLVNNKINLLSLEDSVNIRNKFFQSQNIVQNSGSFYMILAILEKKLGVDDKYKQMLKKAYELEPNHPEILREIAFNEINANNFQNAVNIFRQITKIIPNDWKAWNDAAYVLKSANNTQGALDCLNEGCNISNQNHIIYANKALLEYELHDYENAQISLDKCFDLVQNYPEALHTQAMLFAGIGEIEKAIEYDRLAIQIKPNYPQARLSLGLFLITNGQFEEGFMLYEERWVGSDKSQVNRLDTIGRAMWSGRDVHPSSAIAVLPEQGFGDMIQFSRFIPTLLEKFRKVEWVVIKELYRLMHYNFNSDNLNVLLDKSQIDVKSIDYEIPFMSLPYALKLTLNNINPSDGYLKVPSNANKFKPFFDNIKGLKVGIAWTGKPTLSKQELRSIDSKLLNILDHKDIHFFSLQKGENLTHPNLTNYYDLTNECLDFFDTALLISNLDLVISVDTSIVHLSAALGKETWLLNRLGSEWRWLINKNYSIWYHNMKIFNQSSLKNWTPTLLNVFQSLTLKL